MPKRRDEVAAASPAVMRVNPTLAAAIGINESIVLLQMSYLVNISTTEQHEGRHWTYQTFEAMHQMFPWMSVSTIKRTIKSLVTDGLLIVGHWSNRPLDRTCWYAVNNELLAEKSGEPLVQSDTIDGPDCTNASGQNEPMESVNLTSSIVSDWTNGLNKESYLTKTSAKTSTEISLVEPAAAPPSAARSRSTKPQKPDKTDARKALNAQIRLVRVLFAELFAPPTDRDATFLGRNIQDAVQCYPVDDVAGTLRAIAARNPDAKATGRTISLIDLGSWVDEWLAADRPAVFPTAVLFRRSGETNDRPTSRFAQASQRVTDRDGWLQFKQSLQAGGVAASAS